MSEQLENILNSFGERYGKMQHELAQFYFGKEDVSAGQFDNWLEHYGQDFKDVVSGEPSLVAEYAANKGATLRKIKEMMDVKAKGGADGAK